MKRIYVILAFLTYISYQHVSYAQRIDVNLIPRYNTDWILPQAPNVAAFNRYGQYPVDLSSGLVKIEIPIYTIKTSQLELPITLSYHSSGIKVNDMSSTVGLGWSLNAGGMLSINVRGFSDFDAKYKMRDPIPSEVTLSQMKDDGSFLSLMQAMSGSEIGINYDTQADIYSYSISGLISGNFTYDNKWDLIQMPETDNRIERLKDQYDQTTGYIITEDNGIKYYFTKVGSSLQPIARDLRETAAIRGRESKRA